MASPQFADYRPLLNPDAIVIYPSRTKLLLVTAGCVGFVALGLFLLLSPNPQFRDVEVRLAGIAGIAFFGLCLGYAVWRLARPSPALIIHSSGIFDNASALSAGFLAWNEISHIFMASFRNQKFLGIAVKDVEGLLSRQSGLKARLMRMNIRLSGAAINIPANTLPVSLDEVVAKIQEKCPEITIKA
jgi:hypothetical protein